jgi:hypothetical protein
MLLSYRYPDAVLVASAQCVAGLRNTTAAAELRNTTAAAEVTAPRPLDGEWRPVAEQFSAHVHTGVRNMWTLIDLIVDSKTSKTVSTTDVQSLHATSHLLAACISVADGSLPPFASLAKSDVAPVSSGNVPDDVSLSDGRSACPLELPGNVYATLFFSKKTYINGYTFCFLKIDGAGTRNCPWPCSNWWD